MLDYRAPALLRRKRASLLLAARSGRTTAAALQPTNFSKRDRVVICVVSVDFGRECLCRRAHNTSPPHDYLHMPRSLVSPYLFRFLIGRRRKSAWSRHSSLASMTPSDNSAHRFPPQRTLVTILQSGVASRRSLYKNPCAFNRSGIRRSDSCHQSCCESVHDIGIRRSSAPA